MKGVCHECVSAMSNDEGGGSGSTTDGFSGSDYAPSTGHLEHRLQKSLEDALNKVSTLILFLDDMHSSLSFRLKVNKRKLPYSMK